MNTSRKPRPEVLAAAVALLQPVAPGLTGPALLAALRSYEPDGGPAATGPPPAPGKLLRISEVCERAGVSRTTVFALLRAGKLPRVALGRRSVRVPEAALLALAAGR